MPPKVRELRAALRKAGYESRMAKGSHTFWSHPLVPRQQVTLSGNDGDDAKPYQERTVRKALAGLRAVEENEA